MKSFLILFEIMNVKLQIPRNATNASITHLSGKMETVLTLEEQVSVQTNTTANKIETMEATQQFTIKPIIAEDTEAVLTMLKTFFFKDEPLNTFLGLGDCPELEEYSLKCIKDGCSFKAETINGELVGVFLNVLIHRSELPVDGNKSANDCQHPKFKKILQLMDYVDDVFNIFDLYSNVNVVLDGKIVSVNSNYRGKGIAGLLTEHTVQYMRDHNIPLMHVMCTSHYSARVMERLGFHEVYHLNYNDYKVNDEIVFAPAYPHTAVRILVKEVIKNNIN